MNGYQESDLLVGGIGVGWIIFSIFIVIFSIIVFWKIYTKAGEPGWAALVPFYNLYVQFKITWGNGILFLLLLIPLANIVIGLMMPFKLAKVFGRSVGFGFGLLFLPFLFYPILAYGSSEYVGVDLKQQQNPPIIQQQIFIQTPQPNTALPPQANSASPQQSGYAQPQPNAAYAQTQTPASPQPYYPYPQQYYPQGQSAYPQSASGYPPQPAKFSAASTRQWNRLPRLRKHESFSDACLSKMRKSDRLKTGSAIDPNGSEA